MSDDEMVRIPEIDPRRANTVAQEPVAWFVKDFADGWIYFDNAADAMRQVDATGAMWLVASSPCATPQPAPVAVPEVAVNEPYGHWVKHRLTDGVFLPAVCYVPSGPDYTVVPLYTRPTSLADFKKFVDLIEGRAMACDGPVTPFLEQLNAASEIERQRFVSILSALYKEASDV